MPRALQPLAVLFARLGVLLLIYTLLRVVFFLINAEHFPYPPFSAFLGGLRFDLWSIAWINLPYFLLFLVWPRPTGTWARFLKWLYLVTNALGILLNCIDLAYYDFSLKRSTADLFGIATAGNELFYLLPSFLVDFWYVPLLLITSIFIMQWHYAKAARYDKGRPSTVQGRVLWSVVAFVLWGVLTRGGVQYKPITPLHAGNYAAPAYYPLVLNTPFTFLQSLGKPIVKPVEYLSRSEADKAWPVIHHSHSPSLVGDRPNIVVLVMESFGAEYSSVLSGSTSYMPFLDSLMLRSLNFTRAFANGRRSIDGIPAIVASIPLLMDEAFITSPYANANMTTLPNTLARYGYRSSFFHGGHSGTMGFDVFTKAAGFDRYVGMNDHPDQNDHDGSWGIFDGPFLQFFAQELQAEQQPFCSVFFSLSSHHPYNIPEGDEDRFVEGPLKIQRTIRYADDALRRFFITASKMAWYGNTLFIITADHTAQSVLTAKHKVVQDHHIPLLYFMPSRLPTEQRNTITQQIDILPTTLQLIGYPEPFFSLGQSAIADGPHIAVGSRNGVYHAINDERVLQFDGEQVLAFVDHRGNSLVDSKKQHALQQPLRAVIQQFNTYMLRGDLTTEE